MSIASEALLAVSGLFPKRPLTPEDGKEAADLPRKWRSAIATWLDQSKPRKFKAPPKVNAVKMYEKLSAGLDPVEAERLTSLLADDALGAEYLADLSRGFEYVRAGWPAYSVDSPTGVKLLPVGHVDSGAAETLLEAVDNPYSTLLDMQTGALTADQVNALKEVFPALFEMVTAILWEELNERAAKSQSYSLPWSKERVLRVLLEMPVDVPIKRVENPQPSTAAPPVKVDFSQARYKASSLAAQ